MFLQFSPVRRASKKPTLPRHDESEDEEVLSLAPFSPNPKIFFENIEVNKTASRKLLIKNPTNQDVTLNAVTTFPEELVVRLSWLNTTIKKQESESLEITWTPTVEGSWRFSFYLEDGGRIRRDIPVVFKSKSPNKKAKKNGAKSKTKPLPTYISKKIKSPVNSKVTKRNLSPQKRAVLPNITNIPGIIVDSPKTTTFTLEDGKENLLNSNYNNDNLFNSAASSNFNINPMPDNADRRSTYTVKVLNEHRDALLNTNQNSDPTFSDSLESPQISPNKTNINIETPSHTISKRLQSASFMMTPINVTPVTLVRDFHPNYCSTDEKSMDNNKSIEHGKQVCLFADSKNATFELITEKNELNISAGTYVKGNLSIEANISTATYVKSATASPNISGKANVSSSTFVRDASIGDLANIPLSPVDQFKIPQLESFSQSFATRLESLTGESIKNVIEANLWSDVKARSKPLRSIPEESFFSSSLGSSLKRKSDSIFYVTPEKRPNIDSTSGIKDWSKRGGVGHRVAKKSSGLAIKKSINNDNKAVEIAKIQTNQIYIQNPFLLAAAENFDPFLNATLYFNEEWMEEQEKAFKNWLNALLTPHADLDSVEEVQPINVEKLWRECKKKHIANAPTKEALSSQYHTSSRLDSLRKSALKLYKSSEIRNVLSKVSAAIDCGKISIRQDRDLHLDLALQSEIMSILLSYNPLWLRIGLETIFNEVIPLNSNSDLMGLSSFLMNRFFKDPYLLRKYKTVHTPKYNVDIKKFMLRKFFILVYFLDQAKNKKLIVHDPCLFAKNAPIKESREILLKFARETLSAVGDITKYLKLFGYIVTHKQTYINEFDYAVKCLGTDLRDGVRLTRVMEIILLKDDLTKNLRVPAISRLQKVHNMNIVFESLRKAGFQILFDINSKDIVDGHKEKTLSFLWQIIYKFEAPLMVKNVTTIQTWWRSAPILQKREKLRAERQRKNNAAMKIQSWFKRQMLAHKINQFVQLVKIYKEQQRRNQAAIKIQRNIRMYFARKKYNKMKRSTILIQAYSRRWLYNNYYNKRITAAIKIQSCVKMFLAKRRYQKLKYYVRFVEQRYIANKLMLIQKENYDNLRYSVIYIQRMFRSNKIAKRIRTEFLALKYAAITIQQRYRANKSRDIEYGYYQELKWATIVIQRRFRANKEAKAQKEAFLQIKSTTVLIQQKFRAKIAMRKQQYEFNSIRNAAIVMQRRFRAQLAMKKASSTYKTQKSAAIKIQRWYRSVLSMCKAKNDYNQLKSAAILIQQKFRAKIAMRNQRYEFNSLRNSTILIQRRLRAHLAMKQASSTYKTQKSATLKIQRWYRSVLLMHKAKNDYDQLKSATILIQQKFRAKIAMRKQQSEFLELKSATILIQRRFRAQLSMKRKFAEYQAQKAAAIKIQKWRRSILLMRQERTEYNKLKSTTIWLQQKFRANIAMRKQQCKFVVLKSTTVLLQRKFRAKLAMRRDLSTYQAQRFAAIKIQRWYRSILMMRTARDNYQRLKLATTLIQRVYKARLLMKSAIVEYQKLKSAATIMQRRYRALIAMRKEREDFVAIKRAALVIQRRYRARTAAKIERTKYEALRSTTIFIQQKYREKLTVRTEVIKFQKIKTSVVKIQRWYKSLIIRQEFVILRKTVVIVQRRFRANQLTKYESNKFAALKNAAIVIQRRFRANQLMKVTRKHYLNYKKSTIIIQTRFRALSLMKQARDKYQTQKRAALVIQTWFRSLQLMQNQRSSYQKLRTVTITVQRLFRAKIKMKTEMGCYQKLRNAAITIQRRFRANILMRKQRNSFIAQRQAALIIQRRYRATIQMKRDRELFKNLRVATVLIQTLFRAKLSMRIEKLKYMQIRTSVLKIQRWYKTIVIRRNFVAIVKAVIVVQTRFRALKQMEIARSDYLKKKNAAVTIQRCYRRYLIRKREEEERTLRNRAAVIIQKNVRRFLVRCKYAKYLTPEAIEERRIMRIKRAAAVKIQAAWRGHKTRSLESIESTKIRERFRKASKDVTEQKTLKYRVRSALAVLAGPNPSVVDFITPLEDIEYATRRCKTTCLNLSRQLPRGLYSTITSTSRSLPEMKVSTLCIEILINFYKYEPTKAYVWQSEYIEALFAMMLPWCDKEDPLFAAMCTLLWLFAHNKTYKREITNVKDFRGLILKIQSACSRKERMISKVKSKVKSRFEAYTKLPLPSLQPDWGLDLKNKPKLFYNNLHAFQSLRNILEC